MPKLIPYEQFVSIAQCIAAASILSIEINIKQSLLDELERTLIENYVACSSDKAIYLLASDMMRVVDVDRETAVYMIAAKTVGGYVTKYHCEYSDLPIKEVKEIFEATRLVFEKVKVSIL